MEDNIAYHFSRTKFDAMFTTMHIPSFIVLATLTVAAYYIVLTMWIRRKPATILQPVQGPISAAIVAPSASSLMGKPWEPAPPTLEIDRETDFSDWGTVEWLDDEDTILVKAAEKAVEEIQTALQHVASHPANPEEVCDRIRQVVQSYRIFQGTEYYDPINRFIAVTVQKDCGLQLSDSQIAALWNERVGSV